MMVALEVTIMKVSTDHSPNQSVLEWNTELQIAPHGSCSPHGASVFIFSKEQEAPMTDYVVSNGS